MNREDGFKLLNTLKELSTDDVIVHTYLKLAQMEVRMEFVNAGGYGREISDDYVDEIIVNKHLLGLVELLIRFQTSRCSNLTCELIELQQITGVK